MHRDEKAFKALEAKWYARLKEEGFEDIEDDNKNLKNWRYDCLSHRFEGISFINTQNYFIMAEHFLNEHKFVNETQKIIWDYHSQGRSARQISALCQVHGIKASKNKVNRIVRSLTNLMLKVNRVK